MADKKVNRSRNVRFYVTATEEEAEAIRARMAEIGVSSMGAYARKMLIDGYHITLDLTDVKEMVTQLKRIGTNINQIAKRVNETNSIYSSDMEDLQRSYSEIWKATNKILTALSKIK